MKKSERVEFENQVKALYSNHGADWVADYLGCSRNKVIYVACKHQLRLNPGVLDHIRVSKKQNIAVQFKNRHSKIERFAMCGKWA